MDKNFSKIFDKEKKLTSGTGVKNKRKETIKLIIIKKKISKLTTNFF